MSILMKIRQIQIRRRKNREKRKVWAPFLFVLSFTPLKSHRLWENSPSYGCSNHRFDDSGSGWPLVTEPQRVCWDTQFFFSFFFKVPKFSEKSCFFVCIRKNQKEFKVNDTFCKPVNIKILQNNCKVIENFYWERNSSPTADNEIRPHGQNSGSPTGVWSSEPPIGGPLSHPLDCSHLFVPFPPCVNLTYWWVAGPLIVIIPLYILVRNTSRRSNIQVSSYLNSS